MIVGLFVCFVSNSLTCPDQALQLNGALVEGAPSGGNAVATAWS